MRIGLDFDNTIACYDQAIAVLAEEVLELPEELPRTKLALRDFLRSAGREPEWTAFQGELYGPGMRYAKPFEGAIDAMQQLVVAGHDLMIISHRSSRPYTGPPYDLHEAARDWITENLGSNGLFKGETSSINFLETRKEKLACIFDLDCQVFIDDLPEVLQEQDFPATTLGILFDPSAASLSHSMHTRISKWPEVIEIVRSLD